MRGDSQSSDIHIETSTEFAGPSPQARTTAGNATPSGSSRRAWIGGAAAVISGTSILSGGTPALGEPYRWTLAQAVEQLRRRKISSVELTQICLQRSHRFNPTLNAYITFCDEAALAQAKAADQRRSRGGPVPPLLGVPIALKDNIDTQGVLTTAAARLFAKRVPTEDAEVTRRLNSAGTVMLGKLNLDEFAFAGTGVTGCFGPVRNPWKLDRITGGSSAGSAAALAAGLCYASVGSDDGGSVRIPGSHCGVVGFKTSYGRVSTRGVVPSVYSLDTIGPMTRSVEDAALLLQVLAGADPLDAVTSREPVPVYSEALRRSIKPPRVGIPRAYFFEDLDPATSAAVEAAIQHLRPRVASVRDVTLPAWNPVPDGDLDVELYHYHRELFTQSPEQYHPVSRRLLESASKTNAVAYVETLKRLREARRDVTRVFDEVDVLVLPTMREPAPSMDAVMQGMHRYRRSNVSAFNRFGLPAITVPCGFSPEGLPIGLQIVGGAYQESTVLSLAFAYEQSTEWHLRWPVEFGR